MTEERKLVTVLFADIVGSTAMAGEHDAELVRATLDRAFDRVADVVSAHGGTVEKFIGDAVMAVFGVPAAHDDDADRALRAAFALRKIVRATPGRIPLDVRIGVNSGEAVARTDAADQRLVTGVVVNLAQRLQSAAEPGEILAGETAARLTRGAVRYGLPRSIQAKGIGEVTAHPADALLDAVPEQHRGLDGLRAPLIGRDREMGLLREAYERVVTQSAPSLVTVYGNAGTGKSRLTSELVGTLDHDSVRIGRCLPYGEGITFYPLQLILRADAGIDVSDDRAAALAKLRARVAEVLEYTEEAEGVAERLAVLAAILEPREALPDIEPADIPTELRWALRRYVERRAARAPFVLVFEDIHWAEPVLLDLIEHLAELGRGPFLVLCLTRPDLRQSRPSFGAAVPNGLTITLAPLAADDTRRLVAELLAVDAIGDEFRAEVVSRSEGNPLFVEELLRMLIETGRIEQRDGRWVATANGVSLEVPPTLQGLIAARLDRLSPEVKDVLRAGSVAGRLFSVEAIAAVAGTSVASGTLEEAVRRDVLVEADERPSGGGRAFRFRHVLFRDVAYATIPKATRSRMHDRYGRWLEERLGERRSEVVEILAYHADQAFQCAHDVGSDDAALGERALDLLIAAGDLAADRLDHHAARGLFERAVQVADAVGADPARRAHAHGMFALARARIEGGRSPEVVADVAEALQLAEAAGPSRVLAELLLEVAWPLAWARPGEAKELFDRLPVVARATGDATLLVIMLHQQIQFYSWSGDLVTERRIAEEALVVARETGTPEIARVFIRLGRLAARCGRFTEARTYFEAWSAAKPPVRSKPAESFLAWLHASIEQYFGDWSVVVTHNRRALELARESAIPLDVYLRGRDLGLVLLSAGDAAEARARLEEGLPWVDERGSAYHRFLHHHLLARAFAALGDPPAAREHLAAARASVADVGSTFRPLDTASIEIAEAETLSAEGEHARAAEMFEAAIARVDPRSHPDFAPRMSIDHATVLIRGGRAGQARERLKVAREFFADPLAKPWRDRIDQLLVQCDAVPAT